MVIVGCGSVGAPVAIALAQAGVGRFILLDPDILKPSNISRHPLGAQYLGRMKVVQDSGHNIHHDKPDIVTSAILSVLAAARYRQTQHKN